MALALFLGLSALYPTVAIGQVPRVYTYRTAEGRTEERFLPRDLWYPSVYAGGWEGADESAWVVVRLGPALPSMARDEHVSRAAFDNVHRSHIALPPATQQQMVVFEAFPSYNFAPRAKVAL